MISGTCEACGETSIVEWCSWCKAYICERCLHDPRRIPIRMKAAIMRKAKELGIVA